MCLWHGDQGPSPNNYRKSTLLLPTKPGCKWQVYFGTFAKFFAQTRISLLECILHTSLSAISAGNWPGQCSSHPYSSFLGEKLRQDIWRKALRGHMLLHYPSLHLWRNTTCSIMVTAMKTTLSFTVLTGSVIPSTLQLGMGYGTGEADPCAMRSFNTFPPSGLSLQ